SVWVRFGIIETRFMMETIGKASNDRNVCRNNGPNARKLPDRWLDYDPVGKPVKGTRFVPFKTPLSTDFFTNRGKDFGSDDVFDVKALLGYASAHGKEIGLVIDLTATEKYYDPCEWTDRGIEYVKIRCSGHSAHTQTDGVRHFFDVVTAYLNRNANNEFEYCRGYRIEREEYLTSLYGGCEQRLLIAD
uniref:Tyrosine specific protein phosphatases domain-containing protein n=1 Tax=Parascaris univalens TaxID=6257 RepID=A0A915A5V5_PARUN